MMRTDQGTAAAMWRTPTQKSRSIRGRHKRAVLTTLFALAILVATAPTVKAQDRVLSSQDTACRQRLYAVPTRRPYLDDLQHGRAADSVRPLATMAGPSYTLLNESIIP
jgi:hypothetical protein